MNTEYNISDPEYKRIKFEVFEKDSFKCQYCGSVAPIVTLQLRRIQEIQQSEKWLDTAFLSTSCAACEKKQAGEAENAKRSEFISIDELEERLQQLKMLINWRKGMLKIRKQQLANLVQYWENKVPKSPVDNIQRREILRYINKFSGDEIRAAMDMAADKFLKTEADGSLNQESISNALHKIPEICAQKTQIANNHETDGLFQINELLKTNITGFFDSRRAFQWLNYARSWEISLDDLTTMASAVTSWTQFSLNIDKMVEKQKYFLSRGRTQSYST